MTSRSVYLPPWRLDLTVREGVRIPLSRRAIARDVARALTAAAAPSPASLGLILSDDAELASLNRLHMGVDGPTDVLSFPLLSPGSFPRHPGQADPDVGSGAPFALPPRQRLHLGDVVISVEHAAAQARLGQGGQTGRRRGSVAEELRLLAVHGTLHVCGWDHARPAEAAAMRALERRLLDDRSGWTAHAPSGDNRGGAAQGKGERCNG